MKRLVLSALAASMLAASAMSGQAAPLNAPVAPQSAVVHVDWKKQPTHREVKKRVIVKKKVVKRTHRWQRGERYRDWRRHERVDWRRHHLRRPGHGQEWVRVGNDYMLVSILSGVIAGIVAAH
jgi:Ni/Co efflux regulator RcnB